MSRYLWIIDAHYYRGGHLDREWMAHAMCHGHDPELWFPQRSHTRRTYELATRRTARAQAICQSCPVQDKCLHHAITTDTRYGIWGGATAADRARLTGRMPDR